LTKTDAIIRKFQHLNVWRRGDERAPHKPLLILYALGRLQTGADRLIPFDELEKPLARLLEDFGPPRRSIHPELPFFHLQTDGVWEIHDNIGLTIRKGSKNPLRRELRKWRIAGGFEPTLRRSRKVTQ
jgi:putative restriction endonuclease